MTNVEKVMFRHGKIKQEDIDTKAAKSKAVDDAIALYTKDKGKMTKAEIAAVMDTIVANKDALKKAAKK